MPASIIGKTLPSSLILSHPFRAAGIIDSLAASFPSSTSVPEDVLAIIAVSWPAVDSVGAIGGTLARSVAFVLARAASRLHRIADTAPRAHG